MLPLPDGAFLLPLPDGAFTLPLPDLNDGALKEGAFFAFLAEGALNEGALNEGALDDLKPLKRGFFLRFSVRVLGCSGSSDNVGKSTSLASHSWKP